MSNPVTILFAGCGIFWLIASLSLFLLPKRQGLAYAMCLMLLGTCMSSFAGGMLAERRNSAPHPVAAPQTEAAK